MQGNPRGDGKPKLVINLLSKEEEDFLHLPFILFSGISKYYN
jgi:hypothetical protein